MSNKKIVTAVFGDIHGMHDELLELIQQLVDEYKDNPEQELRLVFLGDYIDRGPMSKDVVDKVIDLKDQFGDDAVIALIGNHEQMLLDAIRGGKSDAGLFLMNGGLATLRSYGVSDAKDIPFAHKQFFRNLLTHYEDNLRYYVHAGIAPRVPLDEQSDYDDNTSLSRQWIRQPFLEYTAKHPKYVVHGHTPIGPEIWDNRCNLDSGAVFGGSLTCALFNEDEEKPFKLLQVEVQSRKMHV